MENTTMTHAATAADHHSRPEAHPRVNTITFDNPWEWLAKGWADLTRAPRFSLLYGAFFVLLSYLLTWGLISGDVFFIIPPLLAGFFLVAPLLGIGLYQISENLEKGEPLQFCQALEAWKRNEVQLGAMALVLVMVLLMWMLAGLLLFALLYDQPAPTWENFIPAVFLSGNSPIFVFSGIIVGGLIAAFTYAISAITVPMLMDRDTDVMTAMRTSVEAVRVNWQPMTLWACLIVMFIGVGIVTFYIGLFVAMPLVGHATWHAYRDLVPQD
jgi:uncharacterized membrane protein